MFVAEGSKIFDAQCICGGRICVSIETIFILNIYISRLCFIWFLRKTDMESVTKTFLGRFF